MYKGYRIKDSHFNLGSKIHINDFIFAKRLLQNNFYASGFAFLLSKEITEKIQSGEINNEDCNITIFGYGYYSELLVSRLETFLNKTFENSQISFNHFIIQDETRIDFEKYFNKAFSNKYSNYKEYLFIVVIPISSTLTTSQKIENEFFYQIKSYLKEKFDAKKFNFELFPSYSLIIVTNGNIDNISFQEKDKNKNIATSFWDDHHKYAKTIITKKQRKNYYFVPIISKWQLPYDCNLCFPNNPSDEKILFQTDKVSVTPDFNFGFPELFESNKIDDSNKIIFSLKNQKTDERYLSSDMINFGHHDGSKKHFYYYLIYERIFRGNLARIIKWAEVIGLKINANYNEKANKLIGSTENILLITPDKSENGQFVNLINEIVFNGRANILNFKAENENVYNFNKFFDEEINQASYIFYVDNLMATANSFFAINKLIKHANIYGDQKYKPFVGIFTLINRMDIYTFKSVREEILTDNIYSFIQLNYPAIPIHNNKIDDCHLCFKENFYSKLVNDSALDTIKVFYKNNILEKIKISDKSDIYSQYKDSTRSSRRLHRLAVAHYLFLAFSYEKFKEYFNNKSNNDFDNFVKEFISEYGENIIKNDLVDVTYKITILKILSEPPFIEHKKIKEKLLSWTLYEVIKFEKNSSIMSLQRFDFNYFKILIKTLAILNSNYFIRESFIQYLANLFDRLSKESLKTKESIESQKQQSNLIIDEEKRILKKFINLKVYITAHIKSSILNSENQFLCLEKSLALIDYKSIGTEEAKRLFELLKLENIGLFKQLIPIQKKIFNNIEDLKSNVPVVKIDTITENITSIRDMIEGAANEIAEFKLNYIYKFLEITENKNAFYYFLLLNRFLDITSKSINLDIQEKGKKIEEPFEEKVKYLLKIISEIMDIPNNTNDKKSGGLIIYKYRDTGSSQVKSMNIRDDAYSHFPEHIVLSSIGDEEIKNDFESLLENNLFSVKSFIKGYPFLDDDNYTWSTIRIYKDNNNWKFNDGKSFDYDESIIGDENLINRFNLIRISNWEDNALKGTAVIVLYDSKNTEFELFRTRYILAIRNKIFNFLNTNYNNDAFKSWIEKKKISDIVKSRFGKFKHGAGTHLIRLQDTLKIYNKDLYAYSILIETDVWIGNMFSQYLKNKNIQIGVHLNDLITKIEFVEIENLLFNACKYVRNSKVLSNVASDFENISKDAIKTRLNKQTIVKIIFELFGNSMYRGNSYRNKVFSLRILQNKLIIKSQNARFIKTTKEELEAYVERDFPIEKRELNGIGLFIINKILNQYLNKSIDFITVDKEKNIFELGIPII